MLVSYTNDLGGNEFREIATLEPSTAALVQLVHRFYSSVILIRDPVAAAEVATLARLMFRSLMEDGAFARRFLETVPSRLVTKLEQCMAAAVATGDMDRWPDAPRCAAWFTHHLAIFILLNGLPNPPALDYGVPRRARTTGCDVCTPRNRPNGRGNRSLLSARALEEDVTLIFMHPKLVNTHYLRTDSVHPARHESEGRPQGWT